MQEIKQKRDGKKINVNEEKNGKKEKWQEGNKQKKRKEERMKGGGRKQGEEKVTGHFRFLPKLFPHSPLCTP